jgi:Holliday junction resolvase RusA-like endonuclease
MFVGKFHSKESITISQLMAIVNSGIQWEYEAIVPGETASKSNARQMVRIGRRLVPIKSKKALAYKDCFERLAPTIDPLMDGDVLLFCHIFYATRRPDLDESLIMDCLEGKAYTNDRQIKAKIILHGLDRKSPRTEIKIARIGQ